MQISSTRQLHRKRDQTITIPLFFSNCLFSFYFSSLLLHYSPRSLAFSFSAFLFSFFFRCWIGRNRKLYAQEKVVKFMIIQLFYSNTNIIHPRSVEAARHVFLTILLVARISTRIVIWFLAVGARYLLRNGDRSEISLKVSFRQIS